MVRKHILRWTAPQTLSGKGVEIEGALVNGVLIARTIKADD